LPAALVKTVRAACPVPLADAKAHLRVVSTAEDDYVQALLDGATAEAELECGRGFGVSTWKLVVDHFPLSGDWSGAAAAGYTPGVGYAPPAWWLSGQAAGEIRLPVRPVASVVAVRYYDLAGVQQTVSPSDYWVGGQTARVRSKVGWPETECGRPEAVEVEFTAGDAAGTLPPQARQAILLILASRYVHRGDEIAAADPGRAAEIPPAAKRLLWQLWDGKL
jgi:hypothetical protein